MCGRDALMMLAHGDRLRRLKEPARAVGQLLKIHIVLALFSEPIWCCTSATQGFIHCCCDGGVVFGCAGAPGAEATGAVATAGGVAAVGADVAEIGCPTVAISSGCTIGGHSAATAGS